MFCFLHLLMTVATVALGKACTSTYNSCGTPVRDETVLLQVEASSLRHRSISNASSIASTPKYSLFSSQDNEPDEMTIFLNCESKQVGTFTLTHPIRGGDSGVLYHMAEDHVRLVKFSRTENGAGAPFDEEIQLSTLFPDFTPRTWKCTAIVQTYLSKAGNMMTVQNQKGRGQADFTFPVLVKDLIQGTGLENVLMTLSSPENSGGSGALSQPDTCQLDTRTSKFSRAKYNLVKSLVTGRHRREALKEPLRKQLDCMMGTFAKYCQDHQKAVSDLKPQNWHYGKRNGQGDARLFLVDASILKSEAGIQPAMCPFSIVSDSFFPIGAAVNHQGDTCFGPYWQSWETPATVQDMVALMGQCVDEKETL